MALGILSGCLCHAQSVVTTNQTGGINTVTNLINVPAGVSQLGTDAYAAFRQFSLTNPISVGIIGVKNGKLWGGGLEANTANTNSPVNIGFAALAIETPTTKVVGGSTVAGSKIGFFDATLNLSVSQVENIPVINVPIILRLASGPFASLSGGVLIGEQSTAMGDFSFQITPKLNLDFGGGAINCSGAAAKGLAPVMPMAHINLTAKW